MVSLRIPSGGLSLSEFPSGSGSRKNKAPQAVQIEPAGGESLEQLIIKLRNNAAEILVSLGKKPVFLVDKKPIPIKTTYHPQGLLYQKSDDSSQLRLSAQLNLRDATAREAKSTMDIDLNDPAILALQQGFAEAKEKKDANKAIFVKDNSKLPPMKGGKTALLKAHRVGLFGSNSSSNTKNSTTKSLPTSPSLGGITPQPGHRDAKTIKQDAIKRALIHLLAVRPVSEKYMLNELKCSAEDLKPLLDRYGRESLLDKTKFNLSERGYKELDVWNFPYTREDDRQNAVDRAIAAFDKQRITISDPLWQKLLPKAERGKGKVLSKLSNLHNGPLSRVSTPRINVESAAAADELSDKEKQTEEERQGRLAPQDAQVRSRSQDPLNKKKVSEREAQSKRLFAKDPKKAADLARAKAKAAEEKKKAKEMAKAEEKRAAPRKTAPQTARTSSKVKSAEFVHDSDEDDDLMDSPVQPALLKRKAEDEETTKGPAKKLKAQPEPKKTTQRPSQEQKAADRSAESSADEPLTKKVQQRKAIEAKSNEKKEIAKKPIEKKVQDKSTSEKKKEDTSTKKSVPKDTTEKKAADTSKRTTTDVYEPPKAIKKSQPAAAGSKKTGPGTTALSSQSQSQSTSTSTKPRVSDSQQQQRSAQPMSRTLSHKRSGSSPVKPSPLGSSPPTNASDLENEQTFKSSSKSSSSSGSPLINQRRDRLEAAQKTAVKAAKATSSNTASGTPAINGNSGASDASLKRRANDLDADTHVHGLGLSTSTGPGTNGVSTTTSTQRPTKRPRLPESPPATSPESPTNAPNHNLAHTHTHTHTHNRNRSRTHTITFSIAGSGSTNDSSNDLSPSPPVAHAGGNVEVGAAMTPSQSDLDYARSFRVQLAKYHGLLREVQGMAGEVPVERVEKLRRMHEKLVRHKEEIWSMAGGRA